MKMSLSKIPKKKKNKTNQRSVTVPANYEFMEDDDDDNIAAENEASEYECDTILAKHNDFPYDFPPSWIKNKKKTTRIILRHTYVAKGTVFLRKMKTWYIDHVLKDATEPDKTQWKEYMAVSYTHLRAHETR